MIRDQDGNWIAGPSGDELIPPVSYDATAAPGKWPAPKRGATAALSEQPGPKVAETEEVAESGIEDLAFSPRHVIGMPSVQAAVTASADQMHLAGQEPYRG